MYFEDDYEDNKKRFSVILQRSRNIAGKSQEFMALELGVARKTVQNWEKGISSPTVPQALSWFHVLGQSGVPYFFQYIYPDMEGIKRSDSDEHIHGALMEIVKDLPAESMRQLMFLFYGDHGSSPTAVLQMITAHLQTPMKDRITQAGVIAKNYELAMKKGDLSSPNHCQPNFKLLKEAIDEGEKAFLEGKESYQSGKMFF